MRIVWTVATFAPLVAVVTMQMCMLILISFMYQMMKDTADLTGQIRDKLVQYCFQKSNQI